MKIECANLCVNSTDWNKQAKCGIGLSHTIKKKLGFDLIHSDMGVYVLHCHQKRGDSEMDMILILYVDNLLLLGENSSKIEDVKHQLGKLYQIKDLGPESPGITLDEPYG